jgi:predicted phage tail protein
MNNKVKFILHGEFGNVVGSTWEICAKTPAAGLRIIEANTNKVIKFLADAKEKNTSYQIIVGDEPISSEEELHCSIGKQTEVHFVPIVEGSKSGTGKIIAGILLVVAVFVFQQYYLAPMLQGLGVAAGAGALGGVSAAVGAGFVSGYMAAAALSMGIALIAGGASQLITGNPKTGDYGSGQENAPSYSFGGPVNTTRQGNPVPLCYGKVLCGSALITLQVSSTDITAPVVEQNPDEPLDDTGQISGGGSAHVSETVLRSPFIVNAPFKRVGKPVEI